VPREPLFCFQKMPALPLSLETLSLIAIALLVLVVGLSLALLLSKQATLASFERLLAEHRERANAQVGGMIDSLRRDVQVSANDLRNAQGAQMTGVMSVVQKASDAQVQMQKGLQDSLMSRLSDQSMLQEKRLATLSEGLTGGLESMRRNMGEQLTSIREANSKALGEMRETVEEKLQETLNARISASFKSVEEQLGAVYKGLGEMRQVAQNVDGLRRVLTNVKTRGTFGEVQLSLLLSEILTPEQYACNIATRPGSTERVEFAVRLPGREPNTEIYLPIDAKFPLEDYERLLAASDAADAEQVEISAKALETRILAESEKIRSKYVEVPYTTEFAVLYLPIESLWAEILKRPGLINRVHRDYHVTIAGPTVLAALLNSLQMGFRTLAIEQKSAEVWRLLGQVKAEFVKFTATIDGVEKKIDSVKNALGDVRTRTNVMGRRLRDVEVVQVVAAQSDKLPSEDEVG